MSKGWSLASIAFGSMVVGSSLSLADLKTVPYGVCLAIMCAGMALTLWAGTMMGRLIEREWHKKG